MLEALLPFEVEQFVFSSTMLVHEPTELGGEIDERDPIHESWPYPTSKMKTEVVVDEHPDVARSRVIAWISTSDRPSCTSTTSSRRSFEWSSGERNCQTAIRY